MAPKPMCLGDDPQQDEIQTLAGEAPKEPRSCRDDSSAVVEKLTSDTGILIEPRWAEDSGATGEEGASEAGDIFIIGSEAEVGHTMLKATSAQRSPAFVRYASALKKTVVKSEAWEVLNEKFSEVSALMAVACLFNVSPATVASGLFFCVLAFFLYGLGGQLICTLVGAAYPAFESYKVVEAGDPKEMQLWLSYWVVFAIFTSVEHIGYYAFVCLPFYYPMKLALILWMISPSGRGTKLLYSWFVSPFLHSHRETIDATLSESRKTIRRTTSTAVSTACAFGIDAARGAGLVGVSTLKHGFLFIKPTVGAATQFCTEAAGQAFIKVRSTSASVGGIKPATSSETSECRSRSPVHRLEEVVDEPAAEPETLGDAQEEMLASTLSRRRAGAAGANTEFSTVGAIGCSWW